MPRTGAHAIVVLALALALTGCSTSASIDTEEVTVDASEIDLSSRPSMEEILERYSAMRSEAIRRLDAELGVRGWAASGSESLRMGCAVSSDPLAEQVVPARFDLDGTHAAADFQRALDIVTAVGAEHGFVVATLVDRPGDALISGHDEYGGAFTFGMATNTTFTLGTGCHLWDTPPTPEP